MCGCLSHGPTGDLARNPGMCPDWELNRRTFGLQPVLNLLNYTSQGSEIILTTLRMFKKVEGRMHEHIKQKRERYKKKVPKKAPRGKQKNEMINILDGNNSRLHTADQFLKTKQ